MLQKISKNTVKLVLLLLGVLIIIVGVYKGYSRMEHFAVPDWITDRGYPNTGAEYDLIGDGNGSPNAYCRLVGPDASGKTFYACAFYNDPERNQYATIDYNIYNNTTPSKYSLKPDTTLKQIFDLRQFSSYGMSIYNQINNPVTTTLAATIPSTTMAATTTTTTIPTTIPSTTMESPTTTTTIPTTIPTTTMESPTITIAGTIPTTTMESSTTTMTIVPTTTVTATETEQTLMQLTGSTPMPNSKDETTYEKVPPSLSSSQNETISPSQMLNRMSQNTNQQQSFPQISDVLNGMSNNSIAITPDNNTNNLNDFISNNMLIGNNLYVSPMNGYTLPTTSSSSSSPNRSVSLTNSPLQSQTTVTSGNTKRNISSYFFPLVRVV